MQRALVVVTNSVVHVEPARGLPGTLRKQGKAIKKHLPFLVSANNRRLVNIPANKIGQRQNVVVKRPALASLLDCSTGGKIPGAFRRSVRVGVIRCPWSSGSVEVEGSTCPSVVERIYLRLANLAAETHLVFADRVRQRIFQVTGDVVASRVRRESRAVEPGDRDQRSSD